MKTVRNWATITPDPRHKERSVIRIGRTTIRVTNERLYLLWILFGLVGRNMGFPERYYKEGGK